MAAKSTANVVGAQPHARSQGSRFLATCEDAVVNTIYRNFFYNAVNELFLAMVDLGDVSLDNKYREEVSAITPEQIISSIESFKKKVNER